MNQSPDIRNIVQNPRSVSSLRDFESFLVFDEIQIIWICIFFINVYA